MALGDHIQAPPGIRYGIIDWIWMQCPLCNRVVRFDRSEAGQGRYARSWLASSAKAQDVMIVAMYPPGVEIHDSCSCL